MPSVAGRFGKLAADVVAVALETEVAGDLEADRPLPLDEGPVLDTTMSGAADEATTLADAVVGGPSPVRGSSPKETGGAVGEGGG